MHVINSFRFSSETPGFGNDFVYTLNIDTDNTSHTVPHVFTGTYNYIVDWGDGNTSSTITDTFDSQATHTYATSGEYTIRISGTFTRISFNNHADKLKLIRVDQLGSTGLTSLFKSFLGCSNMLTFGTGDLSSCTTLQEAFQNCSSLTTIDSGSWDTSSVTNLTSAFASCGNLTTMDTSSWDVSSVTNCLLMFYRCFNITGLDTSSWAPVPTDCSFAFHECSSLTTLDLSNWDMSNCINVVQMFRSCTSMTTLTLPDNFVTTNMTSLYRVFSDLAVSTLNTTGWNTSALTSIAESFHTCSNLVNIDTSGWVLSNITSMNSMFVNCSNLSTVDVSSWGCSSLATADLAFFNCSSSSITGLSSWNVTSITSMNFCFFGATLSTTEYDSVLTGWEGQSVNDNVSVHFGNSVYTSGGTSATARANLIADHSWNISDGGTA